MCTARVLARHFEKIVVLDRDSYPPCGEHRVGVPQSHHAHSLLVRGQKELERLFPGFEAAMLRQGAVKLDAQESFAFLRKWGWARRRKSGFRSLWASRPLFEGVIRSELARIPNVELRQRCSAVGLRIERNGRPRASGVVVHEDAGTTTLAADLIVDASGRGSKAPRWFEAAGLEPPRDDVVEPFVGYASRFYRRPPEERRPKHWWWDGLWIEFVAPDLPRGAVAFPTENNLWLVTAVGFGKDYPPGDEQGFLAFLETLASPIVAEAVKVCTPMSDVVVNRSTTNRFRRYETWKVELDGFLAVGDSVCAFNPVYGHGMSSAAASAGELTRAIATVGLGPARLPREHFSNQAKFLRNVWALAAGADFAWPHTAGPRPSGSALLRPYFRLLGESVHCDARIMRRSSRVLHLLDHPSQLLSPAMVGAVLLSTLKRRFRPGAPLLARGSLPPTESRVL